MVGARFQAAGRPLTIVAEYEGHGADDPSGWYYKFDGDNFTHWISAGALPIRFQPLETHMAEQPKLTIHDVLLKINEIRKLTAPPLEGPPPKVVRVDKVLEADALLLDLQERLLDDYGNGPQSETFEGGGGDGAH